MTQATTIFTERSVHLIPLQGRDEISKAIDTFASTMRRGAEKVRKVVGWHGGSGEFDVYWNSSLAMWSVLEADRIETRSWFCFGNDDPKVTRNLNIACEVNSPHQGIDPRVAGMFVRDDEGVVYVTHSGKVGGGRRGIGMSNFRKFLGEKTLVDVRLSKESSRTVFVLGRIDDPGLQRQIALFVQKVVEFKERPKEKAVKQNAIPSLDFTPEFSGSRRPYSVSREIQARCDHGVVVNALESRLAALGFTVCNDQYRDLWLARKGGGASVLFEAKTDVSTGSIYCAVGQLMLHGTIGTSIPNRVLVVPSLPGSQTHQALSVLGIRVVTYSITDSGISFDGLDQSIRP